MNKKSIIKISLISILILILGIILFFLILPYTKSQEEPINDIKILKTTLSHDWNIETTSEGELENCSTELNIKFLKIPLNISIPFFQSYLGNMTCKQINFLRWITKIEKNIEGNYNSTGIRLYILFLPLLLIFILFIIFKKDILDIIIEEWKKRKKRKISE